MDPRLLLVAAITLLFKENRLRDNAYQSEGLVREVITTLKLPEVTVDFDRTREILESLRATALWMCENNQREPYNRDNFMQRIRINVSEDETLYSAIEQGISAETSIEELKLQCTELRHDLNTYLARLKIRDIIKKRSAEVFFKSDEITNWGQWVTTVIQELEPLQVIGSNGAVEGMLDEVDFSDLDASTAALQQSQNEQSNVGSFRLGIQALNRMLGDVGGLRRGEMVSVGALQHNFKSGMLLLMFKWLAIYNKPHMFDPNKKPLLLYITTENELKDNVMWLYANLWENENGKECILKDVNVSEAASFIRDRLSVNGFHTRMIRMNPSDTTFHSVFELYDRLEKEGYEIQAVVFDYLNMISKRGTNPGPAGSDTRDLFRRMRNFFSARKCLCITASQLSTEAKMLIRQGSADEFVKEIANKGYYDSCRTLDQEVDLELYIHIVVYGGKSWLTVQRGKHRKPKPTPHHLLYTVIPFSPVGALPDDINGPDRSVKAVGAGAGNDGGGNGDAGDWWTTNDGSNSNQPPIEEILI